MGEHPDVFNDPSFSLTAMHTTTDPFPMDVSEGLDHEPGLVPDNPAAAMYDVRQQQPMVQLEQMTSAKPLPPLAPGAVGLPVISRGGMCPPSSHIPNAVLIVISLIPLN